MFAHKFLIKINVHPRVILITIVVASTIMGDSMLYNVLPAGFPVFGLSLGLIGILLSANRWVRIFTNEFAAWVLNRTGIGIPLIISVLVAVATTIVFGLTSAFWILLLARLLWGTCFSFFRLIGFVTVLEVSTDSNRGKSLGFFEGGKRIGSVIGVLIGGFLFDYAGRLNSFTKIGGLGLLGLPISFYLYSTSKSDKNSPHKFNRETSATDNLKFIPKQNLFPRLKRLFSGLLVPNVADLATKNRRIILFSSITFFSLHLVTNGALISSLGLFLNQRLGLELAILGMIIGIASLNGILIGARHIAEVFAPLWGSLTDIYGGRKILALGMPMCIATLIILASQVPLWLAIASLSLSFMASVACMTALDTIVGSLAPESHRPQIMGRYATWQDLGSAIGPIAIFSALDFISLSATYITGAIILSLTLIIFQLTTIGQRPST